MCDTPPPPPQGGASFDPKGSFEQTPLGFTRRCYTPNIKALCPESKESTRLPIFTSTKWARMSDFSDTVIQQDEYNKSDFIFLYSCDGFLPMFLYW